MTKCSFCGQDLEPGTGKLLVKIDGSALYFCNGKCEKNSSMRDNKKVKWTEAWRKLKGKKVKK